jgi:hypothetical protein
MHRCEEMQRKKRRPQCESQFICWSAQNIDDDFKNDGRDRADSIAELTFRVRRIDFICAYVVYQRLDLIFIRFSGESGI